MCLPIFARSIAGYVDSPHFPDREHNQRHNPGVHPRCLSLCRLQSHSETSLHTSQWHFEIPASLVAVVCDAVKGYNLSEGKVNDAKRTNPSALRLQGPS